MHPLTLKSTLSPIAIGLMLAGGSAAQAMPFISEIHYDNTSTDIGEAIEITASAGTDMTGWSIALYNGSNGSLYNTRTFSETISDCGNGSGVTVLEYPSNGIQNGSPDGIALIDAEGNVVQFLSYEGTLTAVDGPAASLESTDIGAAESSSTAVGDSLQLSAVDGSWSVSANSFGLVNGETQCDGGGSGSGEVAQDARINEIHYDNDGSDIGEAIEITAEAGAASTGWEIVLYNGNGGTPYGTVALTGNFSDHGNGRGSLVVNFPSNGLQNGSPDGVALVNPEGNVIEFISYEGEMVAQAGPAAGMTSVDIGVSEPSSNPIGNSLQRCPESDTWQAPAANTFGAINASCVAAPTCGEVDNLTPIYTVQGAQQVSPLVLAADQSVVDFFANLPANTFNIRGQSVTTSGIVTATDSNGFYLQDLAGDGDDATSDALFVFTGGAPDVAVGDEIEVAGDVVEFFPGDTDTRNLPITQIASPSVLVCSSGNALPAPVVIGNSNRVPPNTSIDDDAFSDYQPDADGIDFFESLEGMRVTAEDLAVVGGTNRFGEIYAVTNAGTGATGLSARGTLNIAPNDFNPEKIQIDEDTGVFNFDFPAVNVGANLGNVTGVVSYSFGNFEILPTEDFNATITTSNLEAETSAITGDEERLTVASYNVLNLDPNDGDGDADVANGRFAAIAEHIVSALNAPDILGLQEVQDNTGSTNDGVTAADVTLQTLVDAIEAAGGPRYTFIDNTFIGNNTSGGQPGANIRTAMLYNAERVALEEGSIATIGGQGAGEAFEGARLPLAAAFTFNEQTVNIVVNHFSSKGGSAPILGIAQDFANRQEDVSVNGSLDERQRQSAAVRSFVEQTLANDSDANIVVLGDLNEFEFVSPVSGLESAGLTNLTNTVDPLERYSFIFQGNSQSLDHMLVSQGLAETAQFDIVHVNAEFAESQTRASDHDPLLLSVSLAEPTLMGDINGDGIIDRQDWRAFWRAFGAREGSPRYNPAADFDNDGVIWLHDFFAFWYYVVSARR